MPAPARKAPTKKPPTPAQAAVAEALKEGITVEFRGQQFFIPDEIRSSARLAIAEAAGDVPAIIYEVLGPEDSRRWISLCERGESLSDVSAEFFAAAAEASGSGNSSPS